ncbi:MAG: hypothetical protein GY832_01105 [Chloroflexi bacterium]|nr:hypothetical protein [Chloroflexota bacterium]
MFNYDKARNLMIQRLSQAADCHKAGAYEKLEDGFDEMDDGLPRRAGLEFLKLHTSFNFWDGWIDASNHQWKYYQGIKAEDWPILAQHIVADLQADRDITNSLVLEWFSPRKPRNLREKVGSLCRKLVNLIDRGSLDREEAMTVLIQHLVPYKQWSYDELRTLVDSENVVKVAGSSGTKYYFEVYVAPVNENHDELLVEGLVSKVAGRRWLPDVEQAEFGMRPDNTIYYQSNNLSVEFTDRESYAQDI